MLNYDSLESMIDFILRTYHPNLRGELDRVIEESESLKDQYQEQFPELQQVCELLRQFRSEVGPHIDREEQEFFPVLREIEQTALGLREFHDCDLERFDAVIKKMELEHEHFDTYVYDFVKVFERHSPLKQENPHIHEYFLSTYTKLESETRHHTSLENTKLHSLARDLFLQVCHLKNT